MCSFSYDQTVNELAELIKAIVWGDQERIEELFQYTENPAIPEPVSRLAEQVGTLLAQKESREFQLETLIEKYIQTQRELERAWLDPLTALPNRALFMEHLEKRCLQSLQQNNALAVLVIDFDKFKEVNDTMGHSAGDAVLAQGATRLVRGVGKKGQVGRIGGDEFAAFFPMTNLKQAQKKIQQLVVDMRTPFQLPEGQAQISASIGMTLLPVDGCTAANLLKNADVAMYRAKAAGRDGMQMYKPRAEEW